MINLPVEVLSLIFEQLFQRDQLECMTVCRQWYDIISQHSLFPVIYIHSQQKLKKLIKRVKRNPALGSKVKQLTLNFHVVGNFDVIIFLEYFPNLVKFALLKSRHSDYNEAPLTQLQSHPCCETIEDIMEIGSCLNTMAVLKSGLCKNLSQLKVTGNNFEPVHNLVRVLANAPSLKSLYLSGHLVSLSDLELLHRALPSLNTLSFQDVKFDCTSFPLTIVPATSVRSFETRYSSVDHIRYHNTHYRYISQKYTEVEELVLVTRALSLYNRQHTQEFTDYKATIKSYLTTLGHRLEKLSINICILGRDLSDIFDFNTLDECNCQIKRLTLISESNHPLLKLMPSTTQIDYLQSLEIPLLGCDKKGDVSLEWLRQLTMLKRLSITFSSHHRPEKRYTLKLSYFLELLSETEVEDLTLNCLELDNDNSSVVRVYTLLKKLSLSYVALMEKVDVALSQAFPNMRRLKLFFFPLPGGDLLLPNSYLSYLEISSLYRNKNAFVLVNTLDNNQQRLYTAPEGRRMFSKLKFLCGEEKLSNLISTPSKPYDKETDNPAITITCKALWSFVMIDISQ